MATFVLRGKLSAGLFHGESFRMPNSLAHRPRYFQSRLKDSFRLFFLDEDLGANLKGTEKAPIATGGLLFWVTFRNAEEGESLGSCHRVFEIPES